MIGIFTLYERETRKLFIHYGGNLRWKLGVSRIRHRQGWEVGEDLWK